MHHLPHAPHAPPPSITGTSNTTHSPFTASRADASCTLPPIIAPPRWNTTLALAARQLASRCPTSNTRSGVYGTNMAFNASGTAPAIDGWYAQASWRMAEGALTFWGSLLPPPPSPPSRRPLHSSAEATKSSW